MTKFETKKLFHAALVSFAERREIMMKNKEGYSYDDFMSDFDSKVSSIKAEPSTFSKLFKEELEKTLAKTSDSGTIQSEVRSGTLTHKNAPLFIKRDKHANPYYKAVRNSKK